jgi:hypothetical protein
MQIMVRAAFAAGRCMGCLRLTIIVQPQSAPEAQPQVSWQCSLLSRVCLRLVVQGLSLISKQDFSQAFHP